MSAPNPRTAVGTSQVTRGHYFTIGPETDDVIDVFVTDDWDDPLNSIVIVVQDALNTVTTLRTFYDETNGLIDGGLIDIDVLAVEIRRWCDESTTNTPTATSTEDILKAAGVRIEGVK